MPTASSPIMSSESPPGAEEEFEPYVRRKRSEAGGRKKMQGLNEQVSFLFEKSCGNLAICEISINKYVICKFKNCLNATFRGFHLNVLQYLAMNQIMSKAKTMMFLSEVQ